MPWSITAYLILAERKMDKYIVYIVFNHVVISIILTVKSSVNQCTSYKYKASFK